MARQGIAICPTAEGIQERTIVDHQNGKIASLGLRETEADFQATVEWNQSQIAKFTGLFLSSPEVDRYEVITMYEARAKSAPAL